MPLGAFRLNTLSVGPSGPTTQGWILTANTASDDNIGFDVDSSENVYFGFSDSNGSNIVKCDSSGTIAWQRKLKYSTFNAYASDINVDSSGNVYVIGYYYTSSTAYAHFVAKYNSSGTLEWQKTMGNIGSYRRSYRSRLDSSSRPVIVGSQGDSTTQGFVSRFGTDGTGSLGRVIGNTSTSDFLESVNFDPSGNILACGYDSNYFWIVKLTSTGTTSWQRRLSESGTAKGIASDSSSNVYVTGLSGFSQGFMAKYNSTGTLLWQKYLLNPSYSTQTLCVDVDSSANQYYVGRTNVPTAGALITKLDTDGNVSWIRKLTNIQSLTKCKLSGNFLYAIGRQNLTGYPVIVKVPTDGTATGTYGSYVYSSVTLTSGNTSNTSSTVNYSNTSITATSSNTLLVDSAASHTTSYFGAF